MFLSRCMPTKDTCYTAKGKEHLTYKFYKASYTSNLLKGNIPISYEYIHNYYHIYVMFYRYSTSAQPNYYSKDSKL